MKLEPHVPTGVPARGRLTLPTAAGRYDLVRELADQWGADTIRHSDGTGPSPELLERGWMLLSGACWHFRNHETPSRMESARGFRSASGIQSLRKVAWPVNLDSASGLPRLQDFQR